VKVLHVLSSLQVGGIEKLVTDLLTKKEIWPSRCDNELLLINDLHDPVLLRRLVAAGVGLHWIKRPPGSRSPLHLWRILQALWRAKPDLLHCHNEHAVRSAFLSGAFLLRVPVLRTVHLTEAVKHYGRIDMALHRLFVTRVVGVSHAVADECLQMGLPASTIYNGIDLAEFSGKAANNVALTPKQIICVGRLSKWIKGQDLLLHAVAKCRAHGLDVHVSFAGGEAREEPGAQTYLEDLARDLKIDASVSFLGQRDDVASLLAASDVFVLPSRAEGFGLVLVEAMATGVPVIAPSIDGPREILDNGTYGMVFQTGDSDSLHASLTQILTNPASAAHYRLLGLRRAKQFTLDETARSYSIEYETLVRNAARP
jgi:glycosyltransferase involved in cell wall biosynthesis